MKTEEDEAFEAIERRQNGFQAKRAMAADKLQEDRIKYGTSWEKDGERIDPMSVYKEPVTEREALKLALEALEHISKFGCNHVRGVCTCEYREAADAIKAALAQPAQEPVAYLVLFEGAGKLLEFKKGNYIHGAKVEHIPLYTTPPQREWVGLTDEDKSELAKAQHSWEDLCLAVESKLKERNHGT